MSLKLILATTCDALVSMILLLRILFIPITALSIYMIDATAFFSCNFSNKSAHDFHTYETQKSVQISVH